MLFGLVVCTYSSVFVAAPILIYLGLRPEGETLRAADARIAQPAE